MSNSTEFYKHGNWRNWGAPRKEPWHNYEIARVLRDKYAPSDRSEYWIHVHGSTPDQALAAAQTHLDTNGLQGVVFEMGQGSIVSTDPFDKDSLGWFFRLEPVDSARAHEFCSELHTGTDTDWNDGGPVDTYNTGNDLEFLHYLDQKTSYPRGPQPF